MADGEALGVVGSPDERFEMPAGPHGLRVVNAGVNEGDSVTYWGRFIAPARMMIGTIHVGFFDGLPRELQNTGSVLCDGAYRDMIGLVSRNHVILDLTGTQAEVGDIVEVIGPEGPNSLSRVAETANWMVYSLLNHLNPATPRVYLEGGRPVELLE